MVRLKDKENMDWEEIAPASAPAHESPASPPGATPPLAGPRLSRETKIRSSRRLSGDTDDPGDRNYDYESDEFPRLSETEPSPRPAKKRKRRAAQTAPSLGCKRREIEGHLFPVTISSQEEPRDRSPLAYTLDFETIHVRGSLVRTISLLCAPQG